MDEIICPQCAHSNPIDAVFCERCGALLPPARPATEPLPPTLRPGEEPVKKSTAELEPLLPAWMRESRQVQSEPPPAPKEEKPAPPPDPLASLSASEPEEEIPEWLKELGILSEKPSPSSEELRFEWEEKAEEKEETLLPEGDWLQHLGSIPSESSAGGGAVTSRDVGAEPEAPSVPSPLASEAFPEWLQGLSETPSPTGEEGTPDWLKAFAETPEAPTAETPPVTPTGEEGVPDWLKAFAETPEAPAESMPATPAIITPSGEEDIGALLEMEIPDWLSGISAEATTAETPAEEAPALASAELPAWVQAMRPIEAILTGEEKGTEAQEEEREGPLAGLRGVLPAVPTSLPYSRPRTYSIRLNLTPAQQTHVQLLEQLIAEEEQPRPRRAVTPPASPRLLRWFITVLLLIALFVPLFFQTRLTAMPELVPQETWQFIQSFNSLPPSPKILFVLDYEVATSGEIEALTLPALQHLNSTTQANLAFLALNPLDLTMGRRLLDLLHSTQPQMPLPPTLHLGYLPGGISALPLFAATPAAAISEAMRAEWAQSPFQKINTLGDFDRVILVTDNAENARTWIEQTSPWHPHLLIISSARSTPMLLPYFYAGQVQGLIGNLNAAAAYEQVNGIPALGRAYRDAYSAGLLLALLIGLAGFLWGLLTHRAHSQPQEKEA